jgi:MYXO-CTERM domain-containing protein
MKLDRIFGMVCVGMLSSVASYSAQGQNLLVNPGFETGTFAGWTLSGSTAFEGVSTSFASTPADGRYSAFFGAVGAYNIISQTITTTPGDVYDISFALDNSGGPYSEMFVDWGSSQVFDIQPTGSFGWTVLGWNQPATSASTTISFGFEQVPSYFNLDDTSVVDLTHHNPDITPDDIQNTDPGPSPGGPLKAPDQGGSWTAAATLFGLCAVASYRRRQHAG